MIFLSRDATDILSEIILCAAGCIDWSRFSSIHPFNSNSFPLVIMLTTRGNQ